MPVGLINVHCRIEIYAGIFVRVEMNVTKRAVEEILSVGSALGSGEQSVHRDDSFEEIQCLGNERPSGW